MLIRVVLAGDSSIVEISDILFIVRGPTAGGTLME